MPVTYRKWFGIECLHDFFSDGRCRALSVHPTRECELLLERYSCLFRPMEGAGAVYYADSGDAEPFRNFSESRPLGFTLTCDDPLLETYTDIDLSGARVSPAKSFYYFNNADRNIEPDGAEARLLLHPPGAALENGPVAVKPGTFMIRFDTPLSDAALGVRDSLHQKTVWETKTPKEKVNGWNLNLTDVPSGRYSLLINGKVTLEFYLYEQAPVKIWGLIEIFPGGRGTGDRIPEDCRLVDSNGSAITRNFAVSLSTRRSIWRYHIVSNSPDRQHYEDFTVIGTRKSGSAGSAGQGRDIPFAKLKPEPGIDAHTLLFESQQDIPLRQIPSREHVFSFKPQSTGANSGLKLPYALARNTRLDAGSGSRRMISDVFVYL